MTFIAVKKTQNTFLPVCQGDRALGAVEPSLLDAYRRTSKEEGPSKKKAANTRDTLMESPGVP